MRQLSEVQSPPQSLEGRKEKQVHTRVTTGVGGELSHYEEGAASTPEIQLMRSLWMCSISRSKCVSQAANENPLTTTTETAVWKTGYEIGWGNKQHSSGMEIIYTSSPFHAFSLWHFLFSYTLPSSLHNWRQVIMADRTRVIGAKRVEESLRGEGGAWTNISLYALQSY